MVFNKSFPRGDYALARFLRYAVGDAVKHRGMACCLFRNPRGGRLTAGKFRFNGRVFKSRLVFFHERFRTFILAIRFGKHPRFRKPFLGNRRQTRRARGTAERKEKPRPLKETVRGIQRALRGNSRRRNRRGVFFGCRIRFLRKSDARPKNKKEGGGEKYYKNIIFFQSK